MKVEVILLGGYPSKSLWIGNMEAVPRAGEMLCINPDDGCYSVYQVIHICLHKKTDPAVRIEVKP